MSLPGRPLSVHHDIVVYTRAPTCLNRSMTEKDFQRIQELLTTSLNATEARNAERFDKIDKRLDGIERRLDKLEHETKEMRASMETRFDAIGEQFNEIDTRFAALDEKIDRNHQEVTKRIDALSKDIESQHQDALEAKGALRLLTTQHEQLSGRVAVIESRLQAA